MKKRYLLIVLLLIPFDIADEVTLTFISPDKQDFTNYFLTLKFSGDTHQGLLDSSKVSIDIPNVEIEAILDNLATPVPDYYGFRLVQGNTDFFVFPIGFVQGSIVDLEGNLIPKADLQFNCFTPLEVKLPSTTDNTGFFSIPNIPIGSCTVVASTKNAAGSSEFVVNQGQASKVEVVLTNEVAGTGSRTIIFLLPLLLAAVFLFWIFWKKPKVVKAEIKDETDDDLSKQTKALLETLAPKEKKVIEFLLDNDNHCSQAKIRHGTGTPRTSLSRILQKLEQKKMVHIEKEGKMVSVSLTKFFLDK